MASIQGEGESASGFLLNTIEEGAIDAPDTLGKMLGSERFQQHRSAWTHEIDMRAFSDRPWWNH